MIAVVKVGTSSLTDEVGEIDRPAIEKVAAEIAEAREAGHQVVLVTSGAIAAGLPALGFGERPADSETLQAVSAVGQSRLMRTYDDALSRHGIVAGQVLLAPLDFMHPQQYLHARQTLRRLLAIGALPIVNENDAIADDEIRFGDNDRIAALVAQLIDADVLLILTDAPGLLTADPRLDAQASLIAEISEVDTELEARAGGAGTARGSGGMASKLAAVKIAAWSGVRAVIAAAGRPGVIGAAIRGDARVGTVVRPRDRRIPLRQLWIAFAVTPAGTIVVDDATRAAVVGGGATVPAEGVVKVEGTFEPEAAVQLVDLSGRTFAKGLAAHSSARIAAFVERGDGDLLHVISPDDLVVLE